MRAVVHRNRHYRQWQDDRRHEASESTFELIENRAKAAEKEDPAFDDRRW